MTDLFGYGKFLRESCYQYGEVIGKQFPLYPFLSMVIYWLPPQAVYGVVPKITPSNFGECKEGKSFW
jgi:hypothetical protein